MEGVGEGKRGEDGGTRRWDEDEVGGVGGRGNRSKKDECAGNATKVGSACLSYQGEAMNVSSFSSLLLLTCSSHMAAGKLVPSRAWSC